MQSRWKTWVWNAFFRLPDPFPRAFFRSKTLMRLTYGQSFSVAGIDNKLMEILPGRGFFVEIGGNDGVTQSNTKLLELSRGWTGILVEPHPENARRMRLTRSENTHCIQAACVPFGFGSKFITLNYLDLMSFSEDLDSDLSDPIAHSSAGRKWVRADPRTTQFEALAVPLNDLLIQCKAPKRINFFSLDVEGAELAVLEGVDHNEFRFEWILIECRDFERLQPAMAELGYDFDSTLTGSDYLFRDSGRKPVE